MITWYWLVRDGRRYAGVDVRGAFTLFLGLWNVHSVPTH
jgi:hypothetical protein